MTTTKQIFQELISHLADNVPSIKAWDEWNDQFNDVENSYAVDWPAGAVDVDFKFEPYGELYSQKVSLVITVYLAENILPDTHLKVGTPPHTYTNANNLTLFDYAEEVYQALQGKILQYSKWYSRIQDEKASYSAKGLRGRVLVYEAVSLC